MISFACCPANILATFSHEIDLLCARQDAGDDSKEVHEASTCQSDVALRSSIFEDADQYLSWFPSF